MNSLNHIRNFLRIDGRLATSGMPQPDDFAALRQAGFGGNVRAGVERESQMLKVEN